MAWFILCFQSDTKGFSTIKTRNGKILGKKYSKTQLKPYLSNEIEGETVKIGKGEERECHNTVPDFMFQGQAPNEIIYKVLLVVLNIHFQHTNAIFITPSNQMMVDEHILLSSKGGQC